jgi:hypothetical protein
MIKLHAVKKWIYEELHPLGYKAVQFVESSDVSEEYVVFIFRVASTALMAACFALVSCLP